LTKTKLFEEFVALYPLWRDTCLGRKDSAKKEADFLIQIFQSYNSLQTIIDLGGGVGLHASVLAQEGYFVTLLDRSLSALELAKNRCTAILCIPGSFEKIELNETFDASICMWSTLSYITEEMGRVNFYNWINNYTNKLIILDQPNFLLYPKSYSQTYMGEDERNTIKVIREWTMSGSIKCTHYTIEVHNKYSNKLDLIEDTEYQQYLNVTQLQSYLAKNFRLSNIYGDYDLNEIYKSNESKRCITVFERI